MLRSALTVPDSQRVLRFAVLRLATGQFREDDATKLRAAARAASTPDWKRQDPCLPKSFWFFTDSQAVGFRIVRPLRVPTPAEMQAYWNSGVENDDARLNKAE